MIHLQEEIEETKRYIAQLNEIIEQESKQERELCQQIADLIVATDKWLNDLMKEAMKTIESRRAQLINRSIININVR